MNWLKKELSVSVTETPASPLAPPLRSGTPTADPPPKMKLLSNAELLPSFTPLPSFNWNSMENGPAVWPINGVVFKLMSYVIRPAQDAAGVRNQIKLNRNPGVPLILFPPPSPVPARQSAYSFTLSN